MNWKWRDLWLHNVVPIQERKLSWISRILAVLAIVVISSFTLINHFGLPDQVRQKIQHELQTRGVVVDIQKIAVDWTGRLVVSGVKVYRSVDKELTQVEVDRLKLGFNWVSWWRGEPWLSQVLIERANLKIPLDVETSIILKAVSADIGFRAGELVVRKAEAVCANLHFYADGVLRLEPIPQREPKPTEEVKSDYARVWRSLEKYLNEFSQPIRVELKVQTSLADPMSGEIALDVMSQAFQWRQLAIDQLWIRLTSSNGDWRVQNLELQSKGVEIKGGGVAKSKERNALLKLNAVFAQGWQNLLPKHLRKQWKELQLTQGFSADWDFECDWKDGLKWLLRGRGQANNFFIGAHKYDHFEFSLSWDGRRILLPQLVLANAQESLNLEAFVDEDSSLRARVRSTLDPTHFRVLMGEAAQPLMRSLKFHQSGPLLDCQVRGSLRDLNGLHVEGDFVISDFTYINGNGTATRIAEAKSPFIWERKILTLPNLNVMRTEDERGGGSIVYDFNDRQVYIHLAEAQVLPALMVPVFGGKMEEYIKPYRFTKPPKVEAWGRVDLEEEKYTDLTVRILQGEGMIYQFLGKDVLVQNIRADLKFEGQKMRVDVMEPTLLFKGKATGTMTFDLEPANTPYHAQFKVEDMQFDQLLKVYFGKEDVHGLCDGEIDLKGNLDDMKSIKGGGTTKITDGDVYQIPVLGAFSQMLGTVIPNLGYSKAKNARADFQFDQGVIHMKEIEIFSTAFVVIGSGKYDFIQDDVDLSMRVNIRGPIGIALFPVSKLFEYRGSGSLSDTRWEAKAF